MIAVFNVRVAVSNLLFSVFGYLLPSLNSVKAVVAEDLDGIREYMTYWVVLSISMFVGTILHMLNFFKHYSPEMKVLFVMWLTLPRFQGAYRIYTLFLRFYFAMYEDEIDQKVDEISGKIRSKLWHKMKAVCWILFISSNDSLLSSGGGSLSNVNVAFEALRVLQNQWESFTGRNEKRKISSGNDNSLLTKDAEEDKYSSNSVVKGSAEHENVEEKPSAAQLLQSRKRLLIEFIDMIEAGFHLTVAIVAGSAQYQPESDKQVQCRVYMVQTKGGKSGVIHVDAASNSRFSLDESVDLMMQAEEMEERDVEGFIAIDEEMGKLQSASFSLDKIVGVEEMEEEGDADADAGVTMELKIKDETYLLSICTGDQDEGSALYMGLQMLVARERSQLRKRPSRNR